jgi:hypothetical protein
MSRLSIPTSQTGTLPAVLLFVSEQQLAITKADVNATRTQKALVRLTSSVGVVFAGALDSIIHTALLIVKAPFSLVKVSVAKWVGLDKYMSEAFDGKELSGHVYKVAASLLMVVKGFTGLYDPNMVLDTGRNWTLYVPNLQSGCEVKMSGAASKDAPAAVAKA